MKHEVNVLRRAGVTIVMAIAAAAGLAQAQMVDSPDTVLSKYVEAVNAGDLTKIRALFAADFEMPQRWANCAKALSAADCQIAMIKASLIEPKAKLAVTGARAERELIRANVTMTGSKVSAAGVERVLVTDELAVKDGKIRSIIHTFRTEDAQTSTYVKKTVGKTPAQSATRDEQGNGAEFAGG